MSEYREEPVEDGTPRPVSETALQPALYLVPTPIGNREDITLRALRILRSAQVIACEDTRTTGRLLELLGIPSPRLLAVHDHNERGAAEKLAEQVAAGMVVAYCSDAGTPGISDPGFVLVREMIARNIPVVSLPCPSAVITALVASGAPCQPFTFVGFAPHKKGRMTFLDAVVARPETVVMYESPFRISKLIDELHVRCPERHVCIARELTKMYEEYIRGTVSEVKSQLESRSPLKGEMVVILHGAE
ncbi:MAG: 16S rRNA (cytidine(1402)-2'-O)-methyltransferase [Candidatus Kapaibacterium sp.]